MDVLRSEITSKSRLLILEWVQVFSEVVCNIIGRFNVSYNKLPLTYAISHPVEAHVDCLGAFLFY
jgi:hypothetical protein